MRGIARGRRGAPALVGALVVAAVVLAACGSSSNSSSSSSSTASSSGKQVKVGAALIGPKNDKSFNQAAYQGAIVATKTNPNIKLTSTLENKATDAQRTDAVNTLAPLNNVVLGVSAAFGPIFNVLAPKFPSKYFINIAGYTPQYQKNVTGFANDWGAPAYVGGVIAANMTKSGTVGYVGGAEIPPTTQAAAAFAAGAKSVKPNIKVLSNIVGDFNDVAKAKAATSAMITDGADVVFPFLDAGIAGAYAAGKASGKDPAMFKLTIPDCTSYANIVGTEVVNNLAATKRHARELREGHAEARRDLPGPPEPEAADDAAVPEVPEERDGREGHQGHDRRRQQRQDQASGQRDQPAPGLPLSGGIQRARAEREQDLVTG